MASSDVDPGITGRAVSVKAFESLHEVSDRLVLVCASARDIALMLRVELRTQRSIRQPA